MCLVAHQTGWELDYIKSIPMYQVLQIIAFGLNWEGNEIKWSHNAGTNNRKRLDDILNGNE